MQALVEVPAARCQATEQRHQLLDMPGDQVAHVAIALPGVIDDDR